MEAKRVGVLAIIGASLMWALEPIFAKLAYENSNFLQTSAIRSMVVAFTSAIYVILTDKSRFKVAKKQVPKLIYLGVVGTVFADLLYFFSLTKIPVINAVLIGHMQPIFIVLIGFFILKEDKLTKYDYIGIFIMMVAGLLVTTRTFQNLYLLRLGTMGDLFVLLSTIAWATTAIVMRKYLKDLNAGVLTFYRFFVASMAFSVYLLSTSSIILSNAYQVIVGVVVGAGTILYYEGLKRIKAAQVSALELSTPFFAAFLGFFVLGETVTMMQIFGIVLLIAGVYFLSKKEEMLF
ncbi:MAG: DMT family transporter [Candidatus Aenigmarchaeota archaeon]|nr:DMT family transporter [Candidatus Aenigmarchaeota archaeon]